MIPSLTGMDKLIHWGVLLCEMTRKIEDIKTFYVDGI